MKRKIYYFSTDYRTDTLSALKKMEKARDGEIVPLTRAEYEAVIRIRVLEVGSNDDNEG